MVKESVKMGGASSNEYWRWTKPNWDRIEVKTPETYGRGQDFYVDVFSRVEAAGKLSGYRFLLAEYMPDRLPFYGDEVVLIVVCDEHYRYPPWMQRIKCVIRPLGAFPQYRDGFPSSRTKMLSLAHFLSKAAKITFDMARSAAITRDIFFYRVIRKVRHVPLPCYFRFEPLILPIADRKIDYAFLGSIDYDESQRGFLHNFFMPPKIANRLEMIRFVAKFREQSSAEAMVRTTSDFEESVKSPAQYVAALQNCKISLCPRGSNYETYRYSESLKSGCIIVGDPLPSAWFYAKHPSIVLKSWAQLPDVLASLLADKAKMDQLAQLSREHWRRNFSEEAIERELTLFIQSVA
jgi:hypothetical protein